MHELSICTAVAEIVREHAAGQPVRRVHLDVGHLRQVVPDTLRFHWDIIVGGTALEGSSLAINHVPVALRCRACDATSTLDEPLFRCAECDSSEVDVTSGEELLVTCLDLGAAH